MKLLLDTLRPVASWYRLQRLIGPCWAVQGHIALAGRGRIYVSPDDNRGKHLLSCRGVTQPYVTWLWRMLANTMKPDLLCDVGANYGEIAFSHRYDCHQKVFLFEANPAIVPYLRRSVASRTDAGAFVTAEEFIGRDGIDVTFQVDGKWSGTSSAYVKVQDASWKGQGTQSMESLALQSRSLDALLERRLPSVTESCALIKIDVEGGEQDVLKGASRVLSELRNWALIVEVHRGAQQRREETEQLFNMLTELGACYYFQRGKRAEVIALEHCTKKTDVCVIKGDVASRAILHARRPCWV